MAKRIWSRPVAVQPTFGHSITHRRVQPNCKEGGKRAPLFGIGLINKRASPRLKEKVKLGISSMKETNKCSENPQINPKNKV